MHASVIFLPMVALLVLPASILAAEPPAIHYQCDKLKHLTVRYYDNPGQQMGYVKLTIGKQQITLQQAMAASGIRYTDGKTYEWWSKGGQGSLTNLGKKHGAVIACTEKAVSAQ